MTSPLAQEKLIALLLGQSIQKLCKKYMIIYYISIIIDYIPLLWRFYFLVMYILVHKDGNCKKINSLKWFVQESNYTGRAMCLIHFDWLKRTMLHVFDSLKRESMESNDRNQTTQVVLYVFTKKNRLINWLIHQSNHCLFHTIDSLEILWSHWINYEEHTHYKC